MIIKRFFMILSMLAIFASVEGASAVFGQTATRGAAVDAPLRLSDLTNRSLGGVWRINLDESDNPLEKIQDRIQKNRAILEEAGTEQTDSLPTVSVSLFPPELLSLEIGRGTYINERLNGFTQSRLVYADGLKREIELGAKLNISVTAAWQREALTIETISPRGNKMTEIFALSADGSKLRVELSIANPKSENIISLHRVYDRLPNDPLLDDGQIQ